MFFRLFLLFTLVPLVELALLVWIAQQTSWPVTLVLIFVPGLIGAWLVRRAGVQCIRGVRHEVACGQVPAGSLLAGLLILVAGALLIAPGVLTDVAAVALLIPPVRRLVRGYLVRRMQARMAAAFSPPPDPPSDQDRIIDVRVIDADRREPPRP